MPLNPTRVPSPGKVRVKATVTIEYDVPEGQNLDGAYVILMSDLMAENGDKIDSTGDCELVKIEKMEMQPRQ